METGEKKERSHRVKVEVSAWMRLTVGYELLAGGEDDQENVIMNKWIYLIATFLYETTQIKLKLTNLQLNDKL